MLAAIFRKLASRLAGGSKAEGMVSRRAAVAGAGLGEVVGVAAASGGVAIARLCSLCSLCGLCRACKSRFEFSFVRRGVGGQLAEQAGQAVLALQEFFESPARWFTWFTWLTPVPPVRGAGG
ncbi:MAG: hypothetical protein V5B40_22280 [Candidatus Accumulibacter meliphilus]|jgi:hypothetical protein|uniref:hypothetical protein n=1 Tax=Candidatus Accumulibacter meliphilus TaxID=2211374 RepID=UPI002FC398A9